MISAMVVKEIVGEGYCFSGGDFSDGRENKIDLGKRNELYLKWVRSDKNRAI